MQTVFRAVYLRYTFVTGSAILFWLHIGIIVAAIFSGLLLPFPIVVALVVLHRFHLFVFDGCIFTHVKKYVGAMPWDLDFLEYAVLRLTGCSITTSQQKALDYGIQAAAVGFAMVGSLGSNWRISFALDWTYLALIASAVAGFCFATYLRAKKRNATLTCTIGSACTDVTNSTYSHLWGVPLENYGIFYYASIATLYGLLLVYSQYATPFMLSLLFILTFAAFAFSLYLTLIQFLVLKHWCSWCLTSAGISTGIVAMAQITPALAM